MYNESLKSFIIDWDLNYPIDLLYRKKYGIRFNSLEHRELNFIDMCIELFEENMLKNGNNKEEDEIYFPGHGLNVLTRMQNQYTPEEADDIFDKIDIKKIAKEELK